MFIAGEQNLRYRYGLEWMVFGEKSRTDFPIPQSIHIAYTATVKEGIILAGYTEIL